MENFQDLAALDNILVQVGPVEKNVSQELLTKRSWHRGNIKANLKHDEIFLHLSKASTEIHTVYSTNLT